MNHSGKIDRVLLPLWSLVIILVGILPLTNFVGHSHWEYIQWLPSAENLRSRRFLFDIVANIALFLPLGYLLDRGRPSGTGRHSLLLSAGAASLLSLGIEWSQVYCHNRQPSPTDVVSNITGSLLGVLLSIRCKGATSQQNPTLTPNPPDHTLVP